MVKQFFISIALACCMLDVSAQNVAPTVSLDTLPSPVAAPGPISLNASASDADGTVDKVEFFNGTALLATVTQAPYSYQWTGVVAGTYAITARVTDNLGAQSVTPASTVTVAGGAAQVYYIYSDQINTAKEIVNAAGTKVWQSDTEPFGANPPNENPAGQGLFTYNQRFPGQYFDRETGLHYNYQRDYDPQTGRYVQSDPIGLEGGINTFGYAEANPIVYVDPFGLSVFAISYPASPDSSAASECGVGDACKKFCERFKKDWRQFVVCMLCAAAEKKPPPPPAPKPPIIRKQEKKDRPPPPPTLPPSPSPPSGPPGS